MNDTTAALNAQRLQWEMMTTAQKRQRVQNAIVDVIDYARRLRQAERRRVRTCLAAQPRQVRYDPV